MARRAERGVDTRGYRCPVPLLMAKRSMRELEVGETLVVLANDPEAPIDFAAWAATAGHTLEEAELELGLEFRLRKNGADVPGTYATWSGARD